MYLHHFIKPCSVLQTKADSTISVLHSDKCRYLKRRMVKSESLLEPERNTGILITLAQFTARLQPVSPNNIMDYVTSTCFSLGFHAT